jgi:thiamine biosynthesis lipoprotein ApbE
MHHIVDPSTGAPTTNGVVAATAVAATAWWAEVLCKVMLVDGGRSHPLVARDAALVWEHDGACRAVGRVGELFRTTTGSPWSLEVGA